MVFSPPSKSMVFKIPTVNPGKFLPGIGLSLVGLCQRDSALPASNKQYGEDNA
jgi:hypothetical protein